MLARETGACVSPCTCPYAGSNTETRLSYDLIKKRRNNNLAALVSIASETRTPNLRTRIPTAGCPGQFFTRAYPKRLLFNLDNILIHLLQSVARVSVNVDGFWGAWILLPQRPKREVWRQCKHELLSTRTFFDSVLCQRDKR